MKRANEVLVGAAVVGAIGLAVAGTIWLSQARLGRSDQVQAARFRIIGGLKKGDPVVLRGVGIGRVEDIALGAANWVDVTLRLRGTVELPAQPVAIISSTTLFGDWGVQISSAADLPDDPEVRKQVVEATRAGRDKWPGATLPDIGQLTAQAGRIATDMALIADRVQDAFDSTSATRLRQAFVDLSQLSRRLREIASAQQENLLRIGGNLDTGTAALARTAEALSRTARRADSATSRDQFQRILSNTDSVSGDLRQIASNLRGFTGAAASQQEAFARIIAHTDSILARVQAGEGTLGRLTRDTTLYTESVQTVHELRQLLQDMRANPRRYFSFSVF